MLSPLSSMAEPSDDEIRIYLKVMNTIALNVKKSDRIVDLKSRFCNMEGVSPNLQEIFMAGERLIDDRTLAEYNICGNSSLDIILDTLSARRLLIKVLDKKSSLKVFAKASDTIHHIKSMVLAKVQMQSQSNEYSLMHNGKLLVTNGDQTLASLNIECGSVLYLVHIPKDTASISVKVPSGEAIKLEVKLLCLVADVKSLVVSMAGAKISCSYLLYKGQRLEECRTLSYYSISDESVLSLQRPDGFQIFVRKPDGKCITLDVLPSDSVSDVRDKIFKKLGCSPFPHFLCVEGRKLEGDQSPAICWLSEGSTLDIRLVLECQPAFQIFVRKQDGQSLTLEVLPSDTPSVVSDKIFKKLGCSPFPHILSRLGGRRLEGDRSLVSYKISKGSTLVIESVPQDHQQLG